MHRCKTLTLFACIASHRHIVETAGHERKHSWSSNDLAAGLGSHVRFQVGKHDTHQALAMFLLASSATSSNSAALRKTRNLHRSSSVEMASRVRGGDLPISMTPVDIASSTSSAADWSGDLLVFPLEKVNASKDFEDGPFSALDSTLSSSLVDIVTTANFTGKAGTSAVMMLPRSSQVSFLAVVGLGDGSSLKPSDVGNLGVALAQMAKSQNAKKVGVVLPSGMVISEQLQQTMVEHVLLELSPDKRYKSDDADQPRLEHVEFLGSQVSSDAIARARKVVAGVLLTRGLVNSPANYVTPSALASTATALAKDFPSLSLKVLEEKECAAMNMGAYLGVSQGAAEPPKFIHLTYSPPNGEAKKKVVLIGKGLTFDSGGYNIKAGAGSMIEKMKTDMGGAGAVLGAARSVAELAPPGVEVHFIVAACENMVSAEAMRPGDILTASNGKTIEILNTDAEGRLTLADALVYADRLKNVDVICDVATLTGACIVALGPKYGAVYSDDKDLLTKLQDSASKQGELLWHMPLAKEYEDQLKSPIADLKNLGNPGGGGSITAALFLKEFIRDKEKGSPNAMWAHMDIAGPVFNDKDGATGYGVRTLTGLVESISADTEAAK
mmetsp:Transcript_52104/g.81338  ORF Transcript_52104/g.81338 Transcript_52104/m.81338 type:complete len:612 (+) Transcript_52104:36-1871(+)